MASSPGGPASQTSRVMDADEGVDLIFLDFEKAFDSVNHRMLCDRVLSYSIHQSVVDWTRTFSTNRTFRIRVEEHLSAPRPVYEETQRNLRAASQWSDDADLPLNAVKCVHLPIGRAPPAPFTLSDGTSIPIAESSKE